MALPCIQLIVRNSSTVVLYRLAIISNDSDGNTIWYIFALASSVLVTKGLVGAKMISGSFTRVGEGVKILGFVVGVSFEIVVKLVWF